ncbi:hypothetical protein OU798_21965 [Prolixibacteraceae bacterium Z1-6]|uniref:Uncharacterized protein n=1 Tax=Draconibacterium aestuarii TaxID=2998507 RepID=A0A9X3J9R1_9BACT|nr:hypothetical protein [Prolixibacteraceae bacterium Z1-6]
MAKKITIGILSLGIIITGIMAMNRLRFIERSMWIFKFNNEQTFNRGFDRHGGNFERERNERSREYERPDFRNIHDSVRQRIFAEREFRSAPDSLREGRTRPLPGDRDSFRKDGFKRGSHGRGGNTVHLNTVGWFLAVFALFTLVTLYIDKFITYRRRNKTVLQE